MGDSRPGIVKDIVHLAGKLPDTTDLFDKNPDVVELLPKNLMKAAEKKRQAEVERKVRKEEREEREKKVVKHQSWHERPVTVMCISEDGSFLFTGGKDKMVLCWDLRGGPKDETKPPKRIEAHRTFAGHDGAVWGIGLLPAARNMLLSGGADGKVLLWGIGDLTKRDTAGTVASASGSMDHGGIVRVITGCPEDLSAGAGG